MWYKIDFNKLIQLTTAPFLQKKVLIAFALSILQPIKTIYNKWLINRADRLYELNHNGQVCYLRRALNDKFDSIQRRIKISDGNKYDRIYIYTLVEQKPKFLGKLFVHSKTDYVDTGVDFIIYVPEDLMTENNYAIKALVNKYKQDVKRFKIVGV